MMDLKAPGEGASLDSGYTLERCIRRDRDGAYFAGLSAKEERVLIKLLPARDPDAERRFATWQRARHLRHAHLLYLRDAGRIELEDDSYFYGVFEYPDDLLAVALEQGPLTEPETRGVLEAVLSALRYLHGQGLTHGAVDPEHIVAIGEEVKLATDCLLEADDREGHEEDVRQMGELVRRLRAPEPLGEPFATLVRHATAAEARQRWTLAEIARLIEDQPAVPPAEPPPPAVDPPAVPEAPAVAQSVWQPVTGGHVSVSLPMSPDRTAPPAAPEAQAIPELAPQVRDETRGFPKWIFVVTAILMFSVLMMDLRRKPESTPATAPPAAAAAASDGAGRSISPATEEAPAPARKMWRVIAFTFRSRDMAAKRAKQIDDRWPELHAEVFAPKGRRGYYLVALGDGMNRLDATRVQRKARELGLPRDTYVQNYSE
jgi:hypothetical protein